MSKNWSPKNWEEAYTIACDKYGEENVSYNKNSNQRIVIKFNDFTITNSHEFTHDITGFYIVFTTRGTVNVYRSTISYIEHIRKYWFSHVSNNGMWSEENHFCFGGTGVAIYDMWNILSSSFKSNNWESFLYLLDSYITWESLEGGPYKRISGLTNTVSSYELERSLDYNNVEKLFRTHIQTNDFDIGIIKNSYNSTISYNIDSSFEKLILSHYPDFGVNVDSNDKIVNDFILTPQISKEIETANKYYLSDIPLNFKGTKINTQIIPPKNEKIDPSKFNIKLHFNIKGRITKYLTDLINNQWTS